MARERRHRPRARRRRGRFSGLYKLLSILLVIVAVTVACVVFFRVNQVTVVGNGRYTQEEIVAVSGIQTGDNLITLPKSRIAARIRVGLPYVESVAIDRVLPDTVVLNIAEHAAAAAVADDKGGWWLLASSGKLLEQTSAPGGVMVVTGLTPQGPVLGDMLSVPETQENRREYVLSLLTVLEDRGLLGDCTEVDCTAPGELLLKYLDFKLKMPASGDFPYMLSLLECAFESGSVSRDGSGTFDFTVSEGKVYYSRS